MNNFKTSFLIAFILIGAFIYNIALAIYIVEGMAIFSVILLLGIFPPIKRILADFVDLFDLYLFLTTVLSTTYLSQAGTIILAVNSVLFTFMLAPYLKEQTKTGKIKSYF